MGKTKIEWATHTWSPITGCSHAGSPGCDHCYARRMAKRLVGRAGYPESPHEFDVTLHPDRLDQPLHWKKPRVVFVCSMSDLFHEDVPFEFIGKVFAFAIPADWHTFLILTKRPERMREFVSWFKAKTGLFLTSFRHIWLGVTVETQAELWRAQELVDIPAAKRFVSVEPCLGLVDFTGYLGQLDGVIVGGESGPGARPMHPDWARSINSQCLAAGVPFTFKQHGEWLAYKALSLEVITSGELRGREFLWVPETPIRGGLAELMVRVGKKAAGRELDGKVWDEFPWELLGLE